MEYRRRCILAPLAFAALLTSNPAPAALITYDLVATINGRITESADPALQVPSQLSDGSLAVGFITFESSTADTDTAADRGFYTDAVIDYQLSVDTLLFDFDPLAPGARNQLVVRDRPAPSHDMISFAGNDGYSAYAAPAGYSFSMNFQADPLAMMPDIFSSDALVEDLSVVPRWWITWTVYNIDTGEIASAVFSEVNSIVRRPVAVPEPATVSLMGLCLVGLGFARRKRPR